MKVAVVLSGHLRYYEKTVESLFKYIVDPLNADVFLHTWNVRGLQIRNSGYKIDQSDIADPKHVEELYKPVSMVIEDWEDVKPKLNANNYKQTAIAVPVENILSMFYKIWAGDVLRREYEKENDFKYDVVIKARPDMLFRSGIPEFELAKVAGKIWVNYVAGDGQVRDHIFFGDNDVMTYMSDLYVKIPDYYSPYVSWPPISLDKGCLIHAETLVGYHARKSGYPYAYSKVNYILPHKHASEINKFQSI